MQYISLQWTQFTRYSISEISGNDISPIRGSQSSYFQIGHMRLLI